MFIRCFVVALLLAVSCTDALAQESVLVQGWEGTAEFTTYPQGAKASLSTDWAAEGTQSLWIGKGTMITTGRLKTRDWSAYQVLRFHVRVPGKEGVLLGLELADGENGYLNRHQNSLSAAAGDSVVDVDISGALWRGEVNKPNRMVQRPIDKNNIQRLAITAQSGEVYVDRIELVKVKAIVAPGAFAFDFGRKGGLVQGQWIGIDPETKWDDAKGYGITAGATAFPKDTPYPTPVMGDGLQMRGAKFEVKLGAGKYIGWVIFERSGFWEREQAAYTKATLSANGKAIHSHDSTPGDAWFKFQDLEVFTQDDVVDKLVLPRQMTADLSFDAVEGKNTFTLSADGVMQHPPRLGGLVLAPDNAEGRAFIEAHKALQRETIAKVHQLINRQKRDGDPSAAKTPLTIAALETGAVIHPGDWPAASASDKPAPMQAMAGISVARLVGLYATKDLTVTAETPVLKGDGGAIPAASVRLLRNVYLPTHLYDQTACWLESKHYKPLERVQVGPEMARAVLVMIDLPPDAKPGTYGGELKIVGTDGAGAKVHEASVPLSVVVHAGQLPPIDMPSGLFMSGVPVPQEIMGDDAYWSASESLLQQIQRGSFTMITGGPNYSYKWLGKEAVFSGAGAVKMIELAKRYGLATKVSNYGGFSPGFGTHPIKPAAGMSLEETYAALHAGFEKFRKANNLPEHYLYAYDEPGTPSEFAAVAERLTLLRKAGFKTIGYTSMADPAKADADHLMLAKETVAPAYNIHSPATLKLVKEQGNEPWVYNQGLSRSASGLDLWRSHRYGAVGRLQWIASIVQGYQYDALDSREPDLSCFYIHSTHGVLITPRYLGVLEGGVEARLLFELQRRADAGAPNADAIRTFLAEIEAMPYRKALDWNTLETLRGKMLTLIAAKSGT